MNDYVHIEAADLRRPNARFTTERQGYQVLTPFGKLGYSPFPNIDEGKWLVSTGGFGVQPLWSPDGRELFFRAPGGMWVAEFESEPTFSAQTPEP